MLVPVDSNFQNFARFICHLHTRRIRWSCEGLIVYSTTNTPDTIEAFIAETYVQLVATESDVLLY